MYSGVLAALLRPRRVAVAAARLWLDLPRTLPADAGLHNLPARACPYLNMPISEHPLI